MSSAAKKPPETEPTLDPDDWSDFRVTSHRMLDDMLDYLEHLRERPVWQPIPQAVRDQFHSALPESPQTLSEIHHQFMQTILPYTVGNAHPGFMGWVHGGGTPVGMLADMLASGINANLGGRDQIPIAVERQILEWVRELFGFPDTASGLFVTGTSMANLISVWVARTAALGPEVREQGMAAAEKTPLTAYASTGAHGSIAQALDLVGLGTASLRKVPVNDRFEMDLAQLEDMIAKDIESGFRPFMVIGTAGTVDVGAIDDLEGLSSICQSKALWFHVDGAFGALGRLSSEIAPCLKGIERADSIAFDFHKWGQVPYDAGFILIRDDALHRQTFASQAAYLHRETRGVAAGSYWPCDYGPDLSRGFRALKTWFTFKAYGTEQLGSVIAHTCRLAHYLGSCIENLPELELLAPVSLNIVCFRYRSSDANKANRHIVTELHESGLAVPSTTIIRDMLAIRVAIVNHRTRQSDIDQLLQAVLRIGAGWEKA